MEKVKIPLRRIGNSQGVLIPKAILAQVGAGSELSLSIKDGAIVLENPPASVLTKSDSANLAAFIQAELAALSGGWCQVDTLIVDLAQVIEGFAQGNHEEARDFLRARRKQINQALKPRED